MHKPFQYIPPKPPIWFNLFWTGMFGLILGLMTATGQRDLMIFYAFFGLIIFVTLTFVCIKIIKSSFLCSLFCAIVLFIATFKFIVAKSYPFKKAWHQFHFKVPVFGNLVQKSILAKVSSRKREYKHPLVT